MTSNYSSRILKWQPLSTNSVWKWFADPIIAGSQLRHVRGAAEGVVRLSAAERLYSGHTASEGIAPPLALPHGLRGYGSLEDGLAAAKRSGKRVFVDISGHGCVNCREMEARVWSDPEELSELS